MQSPSRSLRRLLLVTDFGFILYWCVTALHLLPAQWLFKDYDNPILVAWNWSFFPLDIIASGFGLRSLILWKRGQESWRSLALVSLALTSCAGLMAVSFWTLRADFDPLWRLTNLFLLVWPAPFIVRLMRKREQG
jgi:hypothetical protein